jgi:arsenate reductase (glutaredoxin)
VKITVYGIPNCDQIKKTLGWFRAAGVAIEFHDYKKHGINAETLRDWFAITDWQVFVNRAGTTWRKLPDSTKAAVISAESAIAVLVEFPSIIKRPVVTIGTSGQSLIVGFNPDRFDALLAAG